MPQEVLKNIYRIQVPLPNNPLKILNSYVIMGDERNLMIDTGFRHPECLEALQAGMSELGLHMENTDILLTHLHSDHTGLAPDIASPETKVFISREELPWMFGETRKNNWANDNIKLRRAGFDVEALKTSLQKAPSRGMASDPDFDRFTPVDDGQVLEYGGYKLKAVLTRGHTPAHMCFWMEEQKTMFTGDHVLFDITPNITYWAEMDDALGDYMKSLAMIDKYDVALALPGHRETGDFHARIAHLLEHHEMRLEECLNVVKNNPGLCICDIAGKMTWRIRCSSWEDFPMSQKWFAVGECHSHLRHLEVQGKIRGDYSKDVITYEAL